ncbi:hypothetical protein I6A81_39745, partial [Frankia sp. CN7]|nr:hypothetical protein [Frankia nepalensis]
FFLLAVAGARPPPPPPRQALAVADRAYVLRRGSVVWSGPAEEARQNLRRVESAYLGQGADA